jgi:lysyl-tRNA synthetase class II
MAAPKRFPDRDEIAAVRAEAEQLEAGAASEATRRLAGRVMARRDLGKLVFLDLVDRSGRIQLLCPLERTGEIDVHLGDLVGVSGSPSKSRRGEPSLTVDALEVLARIRTPLPDTFHGLTDVEQRYRKRYLDLLMNEESRRDAILRARMVSEIRAYLDGEGFVEVETPILQPRYGGGFAEPFVTRSTELEADLYLRIADEAADRRWPGEGLRALEGLPERGHLLQALAGVHAGRVVRGVRRLPGHRDADEGPRRACRSRERRNDEGHVPRARGRPRELAGGPFRGGARRTRRVVARPG